MSSDNEKLKPDGQPMSPMGQWLFETMVEAQKESLKDMEEKHDR